MRHKMHKSAAKLFWLGIAYEGHNLTCGKGTKKAINGGSAHNCWQNNTSKRSKEIFTEENLTQLSGERKLNKLKVRGGGDEDEDHQTAYRI